jgi:hypothetical protein
MHKSAQDDALKHVLLILNKARVDESGTEAGPSGS